MVKSFYIYLFNLIALILVTLCWYFFIFNYFNSQINYYSFSLVSLRQAKSRLLKSKLQEGQLEKEIKDLKSKYNNLAKSEKFQTYLEPLIWLINLIESSNLSLSKYKPKEVISKADYNLLKANFVINGDYFDYLKFFESLNKYPFAISCNKFYLKTLENSERLLCSCNLYIKFLS